MKATYLLQRADASLKGMYDRGSGDSENQELALPLEIFRSGQVALRASVDKNVKVLTVFIVISAEKLGFPILDLITSFEATRHFRDGWPGSVCPARVPSSQLHSWVPALVDAHAEWDQDQEENDARISQS